MAFLDVLLLVASDSQLLFPTPYRFRRLLPEEVHLTNEPKSLISPSPWKTRTNNLTRHENHLTNTLRVTFISDVTAAYLDLEFVFQVFCVSFGFSTSVYLRLLRDVIYIVIDAVLVEKFLQFVVHSRELLSTPRLNCKYILQPTIRRYFGIFHCCL